MSDPIAFLLTWTYYGTWLHGDERGSVDAEHNSFGDEFTAPDDTRLRHEVRTMSQHAVTLDAAARRTVADTIRDHCEHRSWTLHAINVRTNHIHAVVSCDCHPKIAIREFKTWATRRLREQQRIERNRTVWTEDGSARWLWNEGSLRRAIEYVAEYQGSDLE